MATAVRTFPGLDGLRIVAATAVVATHAAFWSGSYTPDAGGRALARLDVGVALFFALSGFLLSRPFLQAAAEGRPAPRTAAYLWRRALRILPAYWLTVTAALLLLPGNRDVDWVDWLRFLGLAQVYSPQWQADGLDHLWSLCTEVAFYLVLPALAAALLRLSGRGPWRPLRVLAGLGALSLAGVGWLAWAVGDDRLAGPLELWLPGFAAWFGAGMAMAVLTVSPPGWAPVRWAHQLGTGLWTCWALAGSLFWIATSPLTGPVAFETDSTVAQALTKNVLYAGIAALLLWPLVFGDQSVGRTRRLLASRPVGRLGEVSYGVFLFHLPLLLATWDAFRHPFLLVLVGTWLLAVLVAAASYRWLERPLVTRLRSLVPERRAGTRAPALPDAETVAP